GWIRSGDRGFVDRRGHVFFQGRVKNVIKRSGENVSAEEVEAAIEELAEVAECCVFAVPDRIRTEEVAAVVYARPGAVVDPAALRETCGVRLARWKLPRYVAVRKDPLPRLPNGKIDRVTLAESLDLAASWDAERAECV